MFATAFHFVSGLDFHSLLSHTMSSQTGALFFSCTAYITARWTGWTRCNRSSDVVVSFFLTWVVIWKHESSNPCACFSLIVSTGTHTNLARKVHNADIFAICTCCLSCAGQWKWFSSVKIHVTQAWIWEIWKSRKNKRDEEDTADTGMESGRVLVSKLYHIETDRHHYHLKRR